MIQELSTETGIRLRSIKNIISGAVKSPNKKKVRLHQKIDNFDKNAIRQKIQQFLFRRELPTLKKIVVDLKEDPNFTKLARTSLRILKELNLNTPKKVGTVCLPIEAIL